MMEAPGSSAPGVSRSSWKQRAARNQSWSVVQTLLNRELGFANYSSSTDSASNGMNERLMGRQLLSARLPVHTSAAESPESINLDTGGKQKKVRKGSPSGPPKAQRWFKVTVNASTKMYYVGGLFWRVSLAASSRSVHRVMKRYTNVFYKMEPDPCAGFKKFDSSSRLGKLEDFTVMSYRNSSSTPSSTLLVTVTESGLFSRTDLSSVQRIKCPTTLSFNSVRDLNIRLTDMSVDYTEDLIYLVASSGGHCREIYVVSYPSWDAIMLIQVGIPLRIQISGPIVMILNGTNVEMTSVSKLIEMSEEIESNWSDANVGGANIKSVRRLEKKPRDSLLSVPTKQEYFGVLDAMWPPLYYTKSKSAIHIWPFGEVNPKPVWNCQTDAYTTLLFEPLPDNSNSVFLTRNDQQLLLTWVKGADQPFSYAFSERNPFRQDIPPPEVPRESRRLARACKSGKKYSERSGGRVLALDYFDGLGLLAVCSVVSKSLVVTLYEPRSFKLFKKLHPVEALVSRNRRRSQSDSDDDDERDMGKVDDISKVDFELDFELIFINLHYDNRSELFCIRLLEEDTTFAE